MKRCELFFRFEGAIQWLIGDWLVYGETRKWGETPVIAAKMGYEASTLIDYAKTAKNVQLGVRTPNLSFTHHSLVRYMPPQEQRQWLQHAEAERLSVAKLRKAIKASQQAEAAPEEGSKNQPEDGNATIEKVRQAIDTTYHDLLSEHDRSAPDERRMIRHELVRYVEDLLQFTIDHATQPDELADLEAKMQTVLGELSKARKAHQNPRLL